MSVVLDVNGLSIRMRTPYGRRPPARGEAGVSLLAETPAVPTPTSLKLSCGLKHGWSPCGAGSQVRLAPLIGFPQHPDQHRPERPVLLAVDQQLGEGATLSVAPECSDPRAQPSSRRNARGVLPPR
jgi:hypothetical protein